MNFLHHNIFSTLEVATTTANDSESQTSQRIGVWPKDDVQANEFISLESMIRAKHKSAPSKTTHDHDPG
jgi:hypothetical protein